jgi:hypothetical protein
VNYISGSSKYSGVVKCKTRNQEGYCEYHQKMKPMKPKGWVKDPLPPPPHTYIPRIEK